MNSIWLMILLFIPIFFVVNLVAAAPGRMDLKEVFRVGMRHFVIGTIVVLVVCTVLHLLIGWLIGTSPLW